MMLLQTKPTTSESPESPAKREFGSNLLNEVIHILDVTSPHTRREPAPVRCLQLQLRNVPQGELCCIDYLLCFAFWVHVITEAAQPGVQGHESDALQRPLVDFVCEIVRQLAVFIQQPCLTALHEIFGHLFQRLHISANGR